MRIPHQLKTNAKTELPSQMVFVDTETRPEIIEDGREKHTLWFGMACYIRLRDEDGHADRIEEWLTFDDSSEFWRWLDSRTRSGSKCYVFAHNWNFDGSILHTASRLRELGYQTLQYINENPPFLLRVKNGKRYLALVDTLNYFTMSLEALGESIGIPKLDMPDYSEDRETWEVYCKRDVEVLRDAVLLFREFIEREDLGNFRPTLASQAMNAFRHRFYDGGIFIHADDRTNELERRAYYGGRVECFQLGEVQGPLYYLDVNSLYPSVMVGNEYPVKLERVLRAPTLETVAEYADTHCVVGDFTVETKEPMYAIRNDDRLTFPVGAFDSGLSTPEVRAALARGHLRSCSRLAVYSRGRIFDDYVTTLYEARLRYRAEGNDAFQFMCKIMMNSLYGKFGQRGSVWNEVRDSTDDDPFEWLQQDREGGPIDKYRVRLGKVQKLSRDKEAANSFPAIAAHVTAYGRMHMWTLFESAGLGNVLYTDTDSLVTNEEGYRRLESSIDPSTLGALALEAEAEVATFYGPKDYVFGDIERHKGIRRNAEQLAINQWAQVQFRSWDWHMKTEEEGFIFIDHITKTLHRNYMKGDVHDDGQVTPFVLGEPEH